MASGRPVLAMRDHKEIRAWRFCRAELLRPSSITLDAGSVHRSLHKELLLCCDSATHGRRPARARAPHPWRKWSDAAETPCRLTAQPQRLQRVCTVTRPHPTSETRTRCVSACHRISPPGVSPAGSGLGRLVNPIVDLARGEDELCHLNIGQSSWSCAEEALEFVPDEPVRKGTEVRYRAAGTTVVGGSLSPAGCCRRSVASPLLCVGFRRGFPIPTASRNNTSELH
jgi:hypothetical protein